VTITDKHVTKLTYSELDDAMHTAQRQRRLGEQHIAQLRLDALTINARIDDAIVTQTETQIALDQLLDELNRRGRHTQ